MKRDRLISSSGDVAPILVFGFFTVVVAIILLTFRDYGVTWDEEWQQIYGEYIIAWYRSLFTDRRALDYWLLKYYGGFFDLTANSVSRFLPFGLYESRHLVNAAFALVGIAFTYQIGKQLQNRLLGLTAALFLLLTPAYYGHAFNNAKDIPFAAMFTAGVYYQIKVLGELPSVSWRTTLKLAIAVGLALGVRVGGVLLLMVFAPSLVVWIVLHRKQLHRKIRPLIGSFVLRCGTIAVIAYIVMLSAWPAAQVHPFTHPLGAYSTLRHFDWQNRVFFEGRHILATQLPLHYLPKWLLIQLPEFILAGLLLLLFALAIRIRRRGSEFLNSTLTPERTVLLFAVAVPLAFVFITRPTLYDGMRHFLFVLPAIALLSAFGWVYCLRTLQGWQRAGLGILLVGAMSTTVADMVALHPNQYVYFNRAFAGGLKTAARSYETDYWGNSYREGALWVSAHYDAHQEQRIRVMSCSYPASTRYFLPKERFKYVNITKGTPDLFLATTRNGCDNRFAGRIVHIVSRQGVPLLYVKEVSDFEGSGPGGRKLVAGPTAPR